MSLKKVLFLCALVSLAGCGVKGPPTPYIYVYPDPPPVVEQAPKPPVVQEANSDEVEPEKVVPVKKKRKKK